MLFGFECFPLHEQLKATLCCVLTNYWFVVRLATFPSIFRLPFVLMKVETLKDPSGGCNVSAHKS